MIEERAEYHLRELRVALDPAAPSRILPPIDAGVGRVLDVGCGAGQTLIACRLPAETLAVGIDPSFAAVTLGQSLDPVTGEWSDFPPCKLSGGVWTGSIVVSDSAAWDPATNSCRQLPPSPPRGEPFDDGNGREFAVAIWTGEEYITWSGGTGGDIMWVPNDGAAFRPD